MFQINSNLIYQQFGFSVRYKYIHLVPFLTLLTLAVFLRSNLYKLSILNFYGVFLAGSDNSEAHCVWKCCPLLWKEERGGWTHTSVVCLCETLQKWGVGSLEKKCPKVVVFIDVKLSSLISTLPGYVCLCKEDPVQVTRELCKPLER